MKFLLAAALALLHGAASAQNWPAKPVRLLMPFPAGTGPDVVARLLGERLGGIWGQQVIVENRPGAGGVAGMNALVHAAPDGYTMALVPATAETLRGFQLIGWIAVFAPKNTPVAIVEKVNRDVNMAIQVPELAAKLVEIGFYPSPGSVAGFAEFLKSERERWGKIARDAGVQPQ